MAWPEIEILRGVWRPIMNVLIEKLVLGKERRKRYFLTKVLLTMIRVSYF